MSEDFVFGKITVKEEKVLQTISFQGMSYLLNIPFKNIKQSGSLVINFNNINTLIDKTEIERIMMTTGHNDVFERNIGIQIPFSITPSYTIVSVGFLSSDKKIKVMAEPFVIKSLDKAPEPKPAMVSQAPTPSPPLINFNVGTGGVVLVSSAFAVLLIMLYRHWKRSPQVKDDKV
jgi:hypothetical protein